jgi:acyl-CoA synthetase (AMP-forming)/AMP-acid ligase II
VDAAYYEDLAGRLYGLAIRLSDRLPADQVQWLHHVTEVGEYGLALGDMARMLAHGQVAITDEERSDMLALGSQMEIGGVVEDTLRRCPLAGQ